MSSDHQQAEAFMALIRKNSLPSPSESPEAEVRFPCPPPNVGFMESFFLSHALLTRRVVVGAQSVPSELAAAMCTIEGGSQFCAKISGVSYAGGISATATNQNSVYSPPPDCVVNEFSHQAECHFLDWEQFIFSSDFDSVDPGFFPPDFRELTDDELIPHCVQLVANLSRNSASEECQVLRGGSDADYVRHSNRMLRALNILAHLVLVHRLRRLFLSHTNLLSLLERRCQEHRNPTLKNLSELTEWFLLFHNLLFDLHAGNVDPNLYGLCQNRSIRETICRWATCDIARTEKETVPEYYRAQLSFPHDLAPPGAGGSGGSASVNELCLLSSVAIAIIRKIHSGYERRQTIFLTDFEGFNNSTVSNRSRRLNVKKWISNTLLPIMKVPKEYPNAFGMLWNILDVLVVEDPEPRRKYGPMFASSPEFLDTLFQQLKSCIETWKEALLGSKEEACHTAVMNLIIKMLEWFSADQGFPEVLFPSCGKRNGKEFAHVLCGLYFESMRKPLGCMESLITEPVLCLICSVASAPPEMHGLRMFVLEHPVFSSLVLNSKRFQSLTCCDCHYRCVGIQGLLMKTIECGERTVAKYLEQILEFCKVALPKAVTVLGNSQTTIEGEKDRALLVVRGVIYILAFVVLYVKRDASATKIGRLQAYFFADPCPSEATDEIWLCRIMRTKLLVTDASKPRFCFLLDALLDMFPTLTVDFHMLPASFIGWGPETIPVQSVTQSEGFKLLQGNIPEQARTTLMHYFAHYMEVCGQSPAEVPTFAAWRIENFVKSASYFRNGRATFVYHGHTPEGDLPGRKYVFSKDSCAACGAENAPKKCGRCRRVLYCNATCQRSHWKTHRVICREN